MALPLRSQLPVVGATPEGLATLLIAAATGGAFGGIAGLVGEVSQRVFYAHSGTHVDPPAMAIAVVTFVVAVLHVLGLLPNADAGYL